MNLSDGEGEKSEDLHPRLRSSSWRSNRVLANGEHPSVANDKIRTIELSSTMETVDSGRRYAEVSAEVFKVVVVRVIIEPRSFR